MTPFGNKEAKRIALHQLKQLEEQWRKQMVSVAKSKHASGELIVDTIQEMTLVQGELVKCMLKLED